MPAERANRDLRFLKNVSILDEQVLASPSNQLTSRCLGVKCLLPLSPPAFRGRTEWTSQVSLISDSLFRGCPRSQLRLSFRLLHPFGMLPLSGFQSWSYRPSFYRPHTARVSCPACSRLELLPIQQIKRSSLCLVFLGRFRSSFSW